MSLVDWIGFTACSGLIMRVIAEIFANELCDLRDLMQIKLDDKIENLKGYVERKKGEEFKIKV